MPRLAAIDTVTIHARLIERAGARIVDAEEEIALAVLAAGRDPVIVTTLPVVGVALAEITDHFLDGVEAVDDETVAEQVPARVLAALDSDVDHDEGLGEEIVRHDPSGEASVLIEAEVHGVTKQPNARHVSMRAAWRRAAA